MKQMPHFSPSHRFIGLLLVLFLSSAGLQVMAQTCPPSWLTGSTTLQNTMSPNPFSGTFYNGGSVAHTESSTLLYCLDKTTPVCDGTKDALSPGTPNTNAKIAYAMYLAPYALLGDVGLSNPGLTTTDRRELIWEVLGQSSGCSGSTECNKVLSFVNLYSTSTTFQKTITWMNPPAGGTVYTDDNYKPIFKVETNMSHIFVGGIGGAFCDASGNIIARPSFLNTVSSAYGIPIPGGIIQNLSAPSTVTFYITGGGNFSVEGVVNFDTHSNAPNAQDVTVWEKTGCQSLGYLIGCPGTSHTVNVVCRAPSAPNISVFNANATQFQISTDYLPGIQQWQWAGSGGFTSTDQNIFVNKPAAGSSVTYTVTIATGSNASCTATATIEISTPLSACTAFGSVSASALPPTVATGGASTLSFTGAQAGATYSWAGPNSFSSTDVSPSVSPSGVGAKIYSVTATNPGTGVCTASTTVQVTVTAGNANLSLTKAVSKLNPGAGENITYTVRITNAGPQAATRVVLKDLLPAGLTYVSVNTGTYVPGTGLWEIGTVPVGTTTVTMTVTVN